MPRFSACPNAQRQTDLKKNAGQTYKAKKTSASFLYPSCADFLLVIGFSYLGEIYIFQTVEPPTGAHRIRPRHGGFIRTAQPPGHKAINRRHDKSPVWRPTLDTPEKTGIPECDILPQETESTKRMIS